VSTGTSLFHVFDNVLDNCWLGLIALSREYDLFKAHVLTSKLAMINLINTLIACSFRINELIVFSLEALSP
jgi:hypothetical protein